jgi:thioredoxin-related protein
MYKMKFSRLIILASITVLIPFFGISKEKDNSKVNWLSFEEAFKLNEQTPKKIFIDIYTDWCGYCKRMDAVTFSNPAIIKILNEQYYPVKFNAESKESITFRGFEYINENPNQQRSAHNFAIAILQGKMGYPSFAFFDEELNLITAIAGFRPPETFEPMLIFFVDDVFIQNPDLDHFIRNYQSPKK